MHWDAKDITSSLFNPQDILRLILQYTFTVYSNFNECCNQQNTHSWITDNIYCLISCTYFGLPGHIQGYNSNTTIIVRTLRNVTVLRTVL
jgi:hypothetical protein